MHSSTVSECFCSQSSKVFVATTGPVNVCDLPSKCYVNDFTLTDTCMRVTISKLSIGLCSKHVE